MFLFSTTYVLVVLSIEPMVPRATFQEFTSKERCQAVANAIIESRIPSNPEDPVGYVKALSKVVFCKPK